MTTPTSVLPRIQLIDALRGFALAGVALVHVTEQYLAGPAPEGFMQGVNGGLDNVLQGLIQFFFVGKFFALFSILFGLSFAIQMASAARKGQNFGGRFLWRAVLLFFIGYLHHLFYRGDILSIYALLAPFLIPFERLSPKWILIVAGIFFLSIPRFISYYVFGNDQLFGLESGFQTSAETLYYQTISEGSLPEVMAQNGGYGMKTKMSFQLMFFGRFYYTFGYFLLGLWLGKIGLFRRISEYLPRVKKALLWSIGGWLASAGIVAATFTTAPQPIDFSSWHHVLGINFLGWNDIFQTSITMCAFILLYQKKWWHGKLNWFTPYGRMALTNYILQSVIGTFIFFGWGLGYIGELRNAYLVLIALVVIIAQNWFSRVWLDNYRYGPLEWLWRSATFLKWQSQKKPAPIPAESQGE